MMGIPLARPLSVIVLAAGKGSRMRSALPKVLHPLGGIPMLGRVLQCAEETGASQLVCVVGHGAEQVQGYAQSLRLQAGQVAFAVQDPPQGTGHAVACGIAALPDTGQTLVLYGDVPLLRPETLRHLLERACAEDSVGLLTAMLPNPRGYGRILRDESGALRASVEEKDASPEQRRIQEVNTGVLTAPTALLRQWVSRLKNDNAQGEYYLTDVLAMAVADGYRVSSLCCEDLSEVQGVNSQVDRSQLERQLQARLARQLLESGVSLADPARIDIRGRLRCGQDVQIDHSCVFEGEVELGDQVRIGPNCVLRNVRVSAHARIEAMSHLEDCDIGAKAVVGPYARIRPGSQLGEGAHVGNFTEVKNSSLGAMSKANHLSYIGDATVGERVNIGAGTITCNYDGASKHRTIIGDDAFIGSDTQLVAPVVVGEGATLGAGTTLTADAPAGQLTLSRARQTSVSRWKRPKKTSH
jgi:bifunctional UDP-N-acetylglucosamine pyrophosphorylase/glucosamine-1-phosphate N-acetyltransferase